MRVCWPGARFPPITEIMAAATDLDGGDFLSLGRHCVDAAFLSRFRTPDTLVLSAHVRCLGLGNPPLFP